MNPQTIIGTGIALVFLAVLFSQPIVEVQETETYFTSQPYTYQQSLVRVRQVRNFPWINEVTQYQYTVKNTDSLKGAFVLNFRFDNGLQVDTKTKTVVILAGEEQAVTMNSPLTGESQVTLNVVPPAKSIPQQRIVTKKVSVWGYLPSLLPFIK